MRDANVPPNPRRSSAYASRSPSSCAISSSSGRPGGVPMTSTCQPGWTPTQVSTSSSASWRSRGSACAGLYKTYVLFCKVEPCPASAKPRRPTAASAILEGARRCFATSRVRGRDGRAARGGDRALPRRDLQLVPLEGGALHRARRTRQRAAAACSSPRRGSRRSSTRCSATIRTGSPSTSSSGAGCARTRSSASAGRRSRPSRRATGAAAWIEAAQAANAAALGRLGRGRSASSSASSSTGSPSSAPLGFDAPDPELLRRLTADAIGAPSGAPELVRVGVGVDLCASRTRST